MSQLVAQVRPTFRYRLYHNPSLLVHLKPRVPCVIPFHVSIHWATGPAQSWLDLSAAVTCVITSVPKVLSISEDYVSSCPLYHDASHLDPPIPVQCVQLSPLRVTMPVPISPLVPSTLTVQFVCSFHLCQNACQLGPLNPSTVCAQLSPVSQCLSTVRPQSQGRSWHTASPGPHQSAGRPHCSGPCRQASGSRQRGSGGGRCGNRKGGASSQKPQAKKGKAAHVTMCMHARTLRPWTRTSLHKA